MKSQSFAGNHTGLLKMSQDGAKTRRLCGRKGGTSTPAIGFARPAFLVYNRGASQRGFRCAKATCQASRLWSKMGQLESCTRARRIRAEGAPHLLATSGSHCALTKTMSQSGTDRPRSNRAHTQGVSPCAIAPCSTCVTK
jgi:hypothetical protein